MHGNKICSKSKSLGSLEISQSRVVKPVLFCRVGLLLSIWKQSSICRGLTQLPFESEPELSNQQKTLAFPTAEI